MYPGVNWNLNRIKFDTKDYTNGTFWENLVNLWEKTMMLWKLSTTSHFSSWLITGLGSWHSRCGQHHPVGYFCQMWDLCQPLQSTASPSISSHKAVVVQRVRWRPSWRLHNPLLFLLYFLGDFSFLWAWCERRSGVVIHLPLRVIDCWRCWETHRRCALCLPERNPVTSQQRRVSHSMHDVRNVQSCWSFITFQSFDLDKETLKLMFWHFISISRQNSQTNVLLCWAAYICQIPS